MCAFPTIFIKQPEVRSCPDEAVEQIFLFLRSTERLPCFLKSFIYPVYPHTPTRGELTTGSIISASSLRLAHLLQYAFSSTLKYPPTTFVAGFPHTLQRMTGGTFLARIVTGSSSSPSWTTPSLSEMTLRLSSVVDPKSYS